MPIALSAPTSTHAEELPMPHRHTVHSDQREAPRSIDDAKAADTTRHPFTAGRTVGEMYLSGELPWPQEPLLRHCDDPDEIVNDYVALCNDYARAQRQGDHLATRRLQGELEAATASLEDMDTYAKAYALRPLLDALEDTAQDPAAPADPPAATVAHVPEQGRFNGPAPLYRRGRAYIQELAPAFTLASLGHGEFVAQRPTDAHQMLRTVEALDNPDDLQDFIAGVVHELHRQLGRLARQRTTD